MPKAAPAEKDIYLFVVEPDERKGCRSDQIDTITKLISDKIFAEKEDCVAIHKVGFNDIGNFDAVSWNLLKEFHENARKPPRHPLDSSSAFLQDVLDSIEVMSAMAADDVFEAKKVLIFGNFEAFLLKKDDLKTLRDKVMAEDMMLTFVFPDKDEMSQQQLVNYDIVNDVLEDQDGIFIFTMKETLRKVLNLISNRPKRPMPWKIKLQIGTGLEIPVAKYILNRKQAVWTLLSEKASKSSAGENKGVRQTHWLDSEQNEIPESDIADAYAYGDQLVTVEGSPYESGEGCLKLLVFCPRENIHPAYLVGDGADIFFPQEQFQDGVQKFDALLRAMHKANRVAVCRKVWRKNSRVTLCVLAPDVERMGFLSTELCFADDISIPSFAPLIKAGQEDEITEKDQIIDDLITQKTIPDFNPQRGPVDPTVVMFREYVTHKILKGEDAKPKLRDNIALHFEEMIIDEKLVEKLKSSFHLTVKKDISGERPSGKEVFRKRKAEVDELSVDKKTKIKETTSPAEEIQAEAKELEQDVDELLDQL